MLATPASVLGNQYSSEPLNSSVIPQQTDTWVEDFSSSDLSDWRLFTANRTYEATAPHTYNYTIDWGSGSYNIVNQSLELISKPSDLSLAAHDSNVAYGTWSFDFSMHQVSLADSFVFQFIGEAGYGVNLSRYPLGYYIGVFTELDGTFSFYFAHQGDNTFDAWTSSSETELSSSAVSIQHDQSYHMDITRTPLGTFSVYINNKPLYIKIISDQSTTTSGEIFFEITGNSTIDNVSVSDNVLVDYVTPSFTDRQQDFKIKQGDKFRYDMNGTDNTDVVHYSINNTAFAVNADGVVTNTETLDAKTYHLGVTITDDFGNSYTRGFLLKVTASMNPFLWGVPVAVVVIIFVVIVVRKRKLVK